MTRREDDKRDRSGRSGWLCEKGLQPLTVNLTREELWPSAMLIQSTSGSASSCKPVIIQPVLRSFSRLMSHNSSRLPSLNLSFLQGMHIFLLWIQTFSNLLMFSRSLDDRDVIGTSDPYVKSFTTRRTARLQLEHYQENDDENPDWATLWVRLQSQRTKVAILGLDEDDGKRMTSLVMSGLT